MSKKVYNCARSFGEPKHNNTHFQHLNLRYFVEFPRRVNVGISTFLLSDPIFDNDFMPKKHWEMPTALPDPNINARPFVYIQMGAFAAT